MCQPSINCILPPGGTVPPACPSASLHATAASERGGEAPGQEFQDEAHERGGATLAIRVTDKAFATLKLASRGALAERGTAPSA